MPLHIYPSSSFSLRDVREDNKCHNPGGSPEGGQFCGPGTSAKPKIRQAFGKHLPVPPDVTAAIEAVKNDPTIPEDERPRRLFEIVKRRMPGLVAEAERLKAQGERGQVEYEAMLRHIAADSGYDFHTNIMSREIFDTDTDWVVLGPVKGVPRIAVKAADDYKGDVSLVKDVVRGTITVRSPDELNNALVRVLQSGAEVVPGSVKDNTTTPTKEGYRDINVLLRLPGSRMLAELQLIVKPMLEAKLGPGHKLYSIGRALGPNHPRAPEIDRQQYELYNGAWQRALEHAATGAAFLGTLAVALTRIRGVS